MAADDDDDDCAEYYRRRAAELTEWMKPRLRSTAERDRLFVGLLRARIERKAERDGLVARRLRDDAAEARAELRANTEHAADVAARAKRELDAFVDDAFRRRTDGRRGGHDETAEAMAAENVRLAAAVRLRRERLDDHLALVRSAECELDRKRGETDRTRLNVIAAAAARLL